MKLSIVTAVCGAIDITEQWYEETVKSCVTQPELVIVANGCTPEEVEALSDLPITHENRRGSGNKYPVMVTFPEPLGSTRAFNMGLSESSGDVVAMLHNDLIVREPGWDQQVLAWFQQKPNTGVVGFHGSRALGDSNIYRVPYQLIQLARGDNWSNMEDAESHGARTDRPTEVVTVDGMALIARRADLISWGGLDERYVHHMYDHDLCLTARRSGRRNYMLPIRCRHLSGQTANGGRYNDHMEAKGVGRDVDIHRRSHELFYEKWKGTGMLPARCS